jgi:hypothetical protein
MPKSALSLEDLRHPSNWTYDLLHPSINNISWQLELAPPRNCLSDARGSMRTMRIHVISHSREVSGAHYSADFGKNASK